MLRFGDEAFEELVAIDDAEELCRRLLASPWGWGSSTRHAEAVELLASVDGSGELPMSFVALMLCTCRRWDRVTSRLIAAVEDSGLLDRRARRAGRVVPLPRAGDRLPAGVGLPAMARDRPGRRARPHLHG